MITVFDPSPENATKLNQAMHTHLGQSVAYLAECLGRPDATGKWAELIASGIRVQPAAFGAYYDLVDAVQNDRVKAANNLLSEITDRFVSGAAPLIKSLEDDFDASEQERLIRIMSSDKTGASGIIPAEAKDYERFAETLRGTLSILGKIAPELAGEFNRIICDIILVAPDGRSEQSFEGGSSFRLWGALFLNAENKMTPTQLLPSLAHEAGHTVLFGVCREELLTRNPDSELFWSPIRQSNRPMEGIFHATFVSARMMWLLQKMLNADPSFKLDLDETSVQFDQAFKVYADGVDIIRENAALTDTGAQMLAAMEEARRDFAVRG